MKLRQISFLAIGLMFSIFVHAEVLLECNPPMGSTLQNIRITREGDKIYRSELDFRGIFSDKVEISAKSWEEKDLRWKSPADGRIRLKQVHVDGGFYWAYTAAGEGFAVEGDCDDQ